MREGDRVLLRNLSERGGPGKLRSFWEQKIHVVTRKIAEDSPVYEVKPEDGSQGKRTLHRNLLFQCDHLPLERPVKKDVPKRRKRYTKKKTDQKKIMTLTPPEQFSSDSSSELELVPLNWNQDTQEENHQEESSLEDSHVSDEQDDAGSPTQVTTNGSEHRESVSVFIRIRGCPVHPQDSGHRGRGSHHQH